MLPPLRHRHCRAGRRGLLGVRGRLAGAHEDQRKRRNAVSRAVWPEAIVDAHVHLWDPARFRMRWLDGNARLNRCYSVADYRAHTSGVDVAAYVYVQVAVEPAYGLLEARWATERAQ